MTRQAKIRSSVRYAAHITRKGAYIARTQGLRSLYLKVRQRVLPPRVYQPAWNQSYASEALTLVQWLDFTPEQLAQSMATTAAHQGHIDIKTINWYLPHFAHAYYGGVYTILRFAAHFAANHGVHNTFIILGGPDSPAPEEYVRRAAEAFPALAGSVAVVVRSDADLVHVRPSDAAVATLWSTAYYVLKFNQTKRKFYFLQDYEPMFYPAGSTSAQVEASYRFGFYGLTNTVTLKNHYEQDYGGQATYFNPCVDTHLFHPDPNRDWSKRPYKVFFYARPDYWRNGFELGAIALRKVKEQLGAQVQIVSAGQAWNPADYGLEGVVETLGLLSYQATTELYRTCDAGLAMMFTRHPSYLPFEFMASGCLVISNVNSATSWLLKDGENCLLSLPSASSIAETIVRGLQDEALRRQITASAHTLIQEQFSDWSKPAEHVYQYMCEPHTKNMTLSNEAQSNV